MCLPLLFAVFAGTCQTNTTGANGVLPQVSAPATATTATTNEPFSLVQQSEQMRETCIRGRRSICGKILLVLPEGLVVESGYTNLLREPLTSSWLVPGTATASHPANQVESQEPGSICVGTVFLTDLPKARGREPKRFDFVIMEGYPAGEYTYNSLGTIHKTVRRFSAQLARAVALNLQALISPPPPAAAVK